MIVGSGMMAKAVKAIDNQSCLYFCSGVSNSSEEDEDKYEKEAKLISQFYGTNQKIIYFSSYLVNFDSYLSRKYYRHKLNIEELIQENFSNFLIFRLPQVVGMTENKNTLTNFLFNSIVTNSTIEVFRNAKRNLVDIDDVVKVVDFVNNKNIFNNQVVNLIASKNQDIEEIISTFEKVTNKIAHKKLSLNEELDFEIILSERMISVYKFLNIQFDDLYLRQLIEKYYSEVK